MGMHVLLKVFFSILVYFTFSVVGIAVGLAGRGSGQVHLVRFLEVLVYWCPVFLVVALFQTLVLYFLFRCNVKYGWVLPVHIIFSAFHVVTGHFFVFLTDF